MPPSAYYEIGKNPPQPESFSLTQEKINLEKKNRDKLKDGPMVWPVAFGLLFVGAWPLMAIFKASPATGLTIITLFVIITQIIHNERLHEIKNIKINPDYDKYLQALNIWETSQKNFWIGINGITFEHRFAKLLECQGYKVTLTPASNDGGIDIIARKDSINIAIQCKCHKNSVGPRVARELYGVMQSRKSEFQEGMIVCPSGFTKGVYEFINNKPIRLIALSDIIRTAQGGVL